MALSTRRMSGMVAQAGPGGQALLDTLDAFKRKHVTQNKEIIHRNSDLMRENANLTKQLRQVQDDLIATRAENASLKAHNNQLQAQVRKLERQTRHLEAQHSTTANQHKLQNLFSQLDSVVLQLQYVQRACLDEVGGDEAVDWRESPPPDVGNADRLRSDGTSSLSRRVRSGSAGLQRKVSANPDLSLVSEGSQEPSLTASQRLGGIGLDDEEDSEDLYDVHVYTGESATRTEGHVQHGAGLSSSLTSRQSSVEPEELADLIQEALVASPVRPERQGQDSDLARPTSKPLASGLESFTTHDAESLDAVLEVAEDTIRQSRRRNSGVLPIPPQDIRQDNRSATDGSQGTRSSAIPDFLQDLGIHPGDFHLPSRDAESATLAKNRKRSISSVSAMGEPADNAGGLSRTIRHSSSTSSLRSNSASPESSKAGPPAPVVTARVSRRKSVPHLSSEAGSPNTLDQAFNKSGVVRSRTTKPAPLEEGNSSRTVSSEARKPLVAAMQGRPAGGPISLVVPAKVAAVATKIDAGKKEPSNPKAAAASRRSSVSLANKPVKARSDSLSERRGARSRSTTPDAPPPTGDMGFTPILPVELEQDATEITPVLSTNVKTSRTTAPLTPIVHAGLAQANMTVKPDKGKGKARESITETVKKPISSSLAAESSVDTTMTSSQSSSQRSSQSSTAAPSLTATSHTTVQMGTSQSSSHEEASLIAGREGRRARSAVNYQEPSLAKKMRQPAGYVPSIKTVVSTRGVGGHHPSSTQGVRRKSSLENVGRRTGNLSSSNERSMSHQLETVSDSEEEMEVS